MDADKPPKGWPDVWIAWANTFKAIGLKALLTGKFWQFCFLSAVVVFAYRIESADWVKIADLMFASRVVNLLGWFLAVIFAVAGVAIFRLQRTIYLAEINRLAIQRNELQERLSGAAFASSTPQQTPALKSPVVALEGEGQ